MLAYSMWGVLALCGLFVGCEGEPPPVVVPEVQPEPREPIVGPRAISTRAAFDLVDTPEGALLAWGAPQRMGGGLLLLRMSPMGLALSRERNILAPGDPSAPRAVEEFPGDVVEVALSTSTDRYAAAWVARDSNRVTVHSTVGSLEDFRGARHRDHGAIAMRAVGTRGFLALGVSRAGDFSLIHRGREVECADCPAAGDVAIEVKPVRLGVQEDQGLRDGVVLSVPSPCTRTLFGLVSVRDDWYYAVCGRGEVSGQSTAFALRFDPEYAHSETLFEGCSPVGISQAMGGVMSVAQCGEALHAVWLGDAGRSMRRFESVERSVRCIDGLPALELVSEGKPTLQVLLEQRRAGLAPLLPPEIAGPGARAIWTGEALLVGKPLAGEVSVQRYQCEYGELTRTNPL